jgi:transketolase
MALGLRYLKKNCRVFVLLGDGETQEGQVWEAAMAASHFKLDNLTAILDHNQLQVDGLVSKVMNIEPLVDKWRSFGWTTIKVDGHNIKELLRVLKEACSSKGKPTIIIADTIKGKGVSYMENIPHWHGTRVPNREELAQAIAELKGESDE